MLPLLLRALRTRPREVDRPLVQLVLGLAELPLDSLELVPRRVWQVRVGAFETLDLGGLVSDLVLEASVASVEIEGDSTDESLCCKL